jgi:uncharacterized protein (TIGR02594 family)
MIRPQAAIVCLALLVLANASAFANRPHRHRHGQLHHHRYYHRVIRELPAKQSARSFLPTFFASSGNANPAGVYDRDTGTWSAPIPESNYSLGARIQRSARNMVVRAGRAVARSTRDAAVATTNESNELVRTARRYMGETAGQLGLPSSLWCADFMNFVLGKTGREGTGSRAASSFADWGIRLKGPQIGAIAVASRPGGNHVGIVSGITSNGDPIIISGNHGHRVAEAVYPRRRFFAFVKPAN